MNRLASEKTALRSSNNVLTGTDAVTGAEVRKVSVLSTSTPPSQPH